MLKRPIVTGTLTSVHITTQQIGMVLKGKVIVKINQHEFHVMKDFCFKIPSGEYYQVLVMATDHSLLLIL